MVSDLLDSLDKDITLKRLLVFGLFVAEGSVTAVAKRLKEEQSAVRQNLNKLRDVYGGRPLYEETRDSDGRLVLTDLGRELLPIATQSVHLWSAAGRLGSGAIVIEFLPQHTYFVSLVTKALRETTKIKLRPLGEHDRDRNRFEGEVMGRLQDGVTDALVGLPPRSEGNPKKLEKHYLYTSRLEAMVPVGDVDAMELTDLVARRNLLVAPVTARSRQLLEEKISHYIEDDPGPAERIEQEFYGTKVLVTLGEDGHGVVVVPSDVAHPFKSGNRLGGPESAGFKWVPVQHKGERFTQKVYVTTRDNPGSDLLRFVELLRSEVARLGLDRSADDPSK